MMVAPFQLAPSKQYHDGQAVLTYAHLVELARPSVYTIYPENLITLIKQLFLDDYLWWLAVLPTMSDYYVLA